MKKMEGKVVLITGGARGIGYGRTNAKDRYAGGDKNRRTAGGGNNRGRANASEKKNTKKTIRNVHHKKAGAGKK